MKLIILLCVIATLVFGALSRQALPFAQMDISTISAAAGFQLTPTTMKDLLILPDLSGSNAVISIRRRDSDGNYPIVANYTKGTFIVTNGKWIAVPSLSGNSIPLVSIDSNNVLSTTSYINKTLGGYLLSDDTFVAAYAGSTLIFRSYQYTASNNTWNAIPGTDLSVATSALWFGEISTYRASDTHLVFIDYSSTDYHVALYARQADKSWSFVESIPVNNTFAATYGSVMYNGIDTLVYSRPLQAVATDYLGIVFVYTKVNGEWIEQTFTVQSVGYKLRGLLGGQVMFTDANTLYLSAGYEGYDASADSPFLGGKILMLTRNTSGLWTPVLDLVGDTGIFGFGFGVNDYDFIVTAVRANSEVVLDAITGTDIILYSIPSCFRDAIDVTCHDQIVDDCSKFSTDLLYTINNPRCGDVAAKITSLSLINNQQVNAQFTFSRAFASPVNCNATVTCPVMQSTPSGNQVPVAKTPSSTPTGKISDASSAIQLGLASLAMIVALL